MRSIVPSFAFSEIMSGESPPPLRFRPPPPARRFPVRTAILLSTAAYLAADLHLLRGPLWKLFFASPAPARVKTPEKDQLPVYDISTTETPGQ